MDHSAQKPEIFRYFDFRLYLSDILTWIRARDPDFTFQKLTETSELNSRSHFIDIINGRKLTKKFLPVYLKICELNEREAKYFKALVLYNQTPVSENRRELFKTIFDLSTNPDIVKLEGEIYTYYEQWYIPAMFSMVSIYRKERDHRVLARFFNPPVSAVQARKALAVLIKLEMIRWDEAKHEWQLEKKQFHSGNGVQVTAMSEFHKQIQKLGQNRYEADFENQTFYAQTHGVSKQLKNKIESMIRDLQSKIQDLVVNEDSSPEVILQINFQTFCLSQIISQHFHQSSSQ